MAMVDLFGQEVAVFRGQPLEKPVFTEADEEAVIDDVIFEGLLIKQLASDLKKVQRMQVKGSTKLNSARRDAWSGLMWCFDLWEKPCELTFDAACALCGSDPENIRNNISVKFADEIRLMYSFIAGNLPEEAKRIRRHLSRYVTLSH